MELWNSNLVECLFGNFEQTVIGTPIWSEYKPQRLELSASDASNKKKGLFLFSGSYSSISFWCVRGYCV
jgi:hypothetical protein